MHTSLMVHLGLLVVREDHFSKRYGGTANYRQTVLSCSAAFSSMCGTVLAAVGRHRPVRPSEVTPLHVSLMVLPATS